MQLNDDERAMLDGRDGAAVQRAMDLLVRYGEALGASRLVDTNNVCGTVGATMPFLRDYAATHGGLDAVFSEFNLDSPEVVEVPKAKVFSSHLQQGLDPQHARRQGIDGEIVKLYRQGEAFTGRLGIQPLNTCAPYLTGNVPVRGEHCAWMESSAVVYCNSVLGARTNTEGRESTSAAMITGKIPDWGFHRDEFRFASHRVDVEVPVESLMDWGMLGYYVGEVVGERIPVLLGKYSQPDLIRHKHFGAAAASSGGVEMYHLVGVTPEAPTFEAAVGPNRQLETFFYGKAEQRRTYETLNSRGKDTNVDYVMLGCPHAALEQIQEICRLLDGKKISANVRLWVFTSRAIRAVADAQGLTKIIRDAGGVVITDTCSAIGQALPPGTKVAALDSAKQVHYLPAIMGIQAWFGSTADCINAALTGRWNGVAP